MAYTKPGVEITQQQASTTPILTTPDLTGVVIGRGYYWQDPLDDDNSVLSSPVYSGVSMTFHLSGINSTYYDVSGDESIVVVDLVESADTINHLTYGEDFSVSNNQVTLSGSLTTNTSYVRVGFRAANADALGFKEMESASDIINIIGEPVTWNPLSFAATLAQSQASTKIYTYGIADDAVSDYNEALAALEYEEVYALAPLSHRVSPTTMVAHCNAMSLPANKKERIVFVNRPIPSWTGDAHAETSSQKATTAAGVRDAYIDTQEKRLFVSFPDFVFIEEARHISTINPTWVENSFAEFTTITDDSYYKCRFASDTEVGTTKYKTGQEITATVWAALVAEGYHELTVLAPCPGFYYGASIVGQVIGNVPEQPLTNVPVAGITRTFGSQDYFSESHLNTIANGGVYILTQRAHTAPIVSRHQMSTNTLSIAKRELSITKALDYTSKFIRNVLSDYIGRYNITTEFLDKIEVLLKNLGKELVEDGVINDLVVAKVEQSSVSPDTILCEIDVEVKHPVNYIRITLVF